MEVPWGPGVGPDEHGHAGRAELLEFVGERGDAAPRQQEIGKRDIARERAADIVHDVGRQALLPCRIVQSLGEAVRRVLVQKQRRDRGGPVQRRVAPAQALEDVVRIAGFRAEPGVLEAIHPVFEPEPDLGFAVCMCHHREPRRVRGLDHGRHFRLRHLVLIDQLDDVHAGLRQLLDLGAGVVRAGHAPTESRLVGRVRRVLKERSRDEQARSGDLTPRDPPLHGEDVFERGAQVARSRHAGEQQLFRRGRHDLLLEPAAVGRVPVLVVAVAHDHQVDVHVGETRQHTHPLGRDDPHAGGNRDLAAAADCGDALAGDENHTVLDRRPAVAVEDTAADQGQRGLLGLRRREIRQRQQQQRARCEHRHDCRPPSMSPSRSCA